MSSRATVTPPIIMIDDDDWLTIVNSEEELNREIEWPYVEETVAAFDSSAIPVALFVDGERIRMNAAAELPDFAGLTAAVERFFGAWTYDEPPDPDQPVADYISDLKRHEAAARYRRRKFRTS